MQLSRIFRISSSAALCAVARTTTTASAFAPSPNGMQLKLQARPLSNTTPTQSSSLLSSIRSRLTSLLSTAREDEVDPGSVEGTSLRILKYPHPSLRAPNAEIPLEELTGPGCPTSQLAKEMFLLMYATNGVGLAAPQVGVNKRLLVYNESGDKRKWMQEVVMVNPKIVEYSTATDVETEGCLSFPEMGGDVTRSKWIKVEAYNLKGKKMKKKFTGWEARVFQHEYDHLESVVYIDRLSEEGRKEVQPRLDELIEEFGEGGVL
ncbi:hypothetical protein ACHAXN_002403 [Cyclotella atomus]